MFVRSYVRSMCVCGNSFIPVYYFLNIEINIATTSDLVPFGCKLPSNRHRNLLSMFFFLVRLFLFASSRHSLIFICFYRVDNCIRLVRFYRDFRQPGLISFHKLYVIAGIVIFWFHFFFSIEDVQNAYIRSTGSCQANAFHHNVYKSGSIRKFTLCFV